MNGLFGIQDPRMRFGAQPLQANQDRVTIGPSPAVQRAAETQPPSQPPSQPSGLFNGYQSPSQGIFQAYMNQIFNQKYAPPMMQGSPLQNFGGFYGFGSPLMPAAQGPMTGQQQGNMDPYTGLSIWDFMGGGSQPGGPYMTPRSPVNG